MKNATNAGSMILSKLEMFNEAIKLFGKEVEPEILQKIDDIISDFAETNGWVGDFQLHGDDANCRLAPIDWNLAEPNDEPDVKAWFGMDCINEDDDYWTVLFCGLGIKGGQAGFMFSVIPQRFGGKAVWNRYASTIDSSLISELAKLDFINRGKGEFFLPILLDASKLADAWENGDFSEALEPLDRALEKLKPAEILFSQIIAGASSRK